MPGLFFKTFLNFKNDSRKDTKHDDNNEDLVFAHNLSKKSILNCVEGMARWIFGCSRLVLTRSFSTDECHAQEHKKRSLKVQQQRRSFASKRSRTFLFFSFSDQDHNSSSNSNNNNHHQQRLNHRANNTVPQCGTWLRRDSEME
jgi:hypothetical protein